MKKIFAVVFSFFLLFIGWGLMQFTDTTTQADWWVRPTEREIQPTREPRVNLAPRTAADLISPTSPPSGATGTGTGASSSNDNPCEPGKSFTGPNCGWSPGISEYSHDSSSGGSSQATGYRIGGPEILGLSDTESAASQVNNSDIALLSGVLCLLIYVKSKFGAKKALLK